MILILLFSFLVLLYHPWTKGPSPPTMNLSYIDVGCDEGTEISASNLPDQLEVLLQYPRAAHPMFWSARVQLEPVFPAFRFP
jgi:hypothetical protein